MRKIILSLVLLSFSICAFSQSDEINISAAFSQSIELKIIGDANVNFVFATISQYQNGYNTYDDAENAVHFQVASSTNFQIDVSHTAFTDGAGNTLDSRYFYYRLSYVGDISEVGTRFVYTPGDRNDASGKGGPANLLDNTVRTLVEPGTSGNAGRFEENYYRMHFGCGNSTMRGVSGLPSLLDANITPGTYTAILTLTAVPVIL